MVIAMIQFRGVKLGGSARFVARAWHFVSGSARAQRVEDEVRLELLKGLVH